MAKLKSLVGVSAIIGLMVSFALADTPGGGPIKYQLSNGAPVPVTQASPLPVAIVSGLPSTLTVAGAVTANQGAPGPTSSPWPVTVPNGVNVLNFPSPVPTQSVAVTNFPSPVPTQSVSVVNFPSPVPTQTITGAVNATIVAPSPLPVSGVMTVQNFPSPVATQPVSAVAWPLPAGAATDSTLTSILNAIKAQVGIANSIWTDSTGAFYIRIVQVDEGTGAVTFSYTTPTGSPATPGSGLMPVSSADMTVSQTPYDAIASGTGYSTGDVLQHTMIIDADSSSPTVVANFWMDITSNTTISAPTAANIAQTTQNVAVTSSVIPPGASTASNQSSEITDLTAINTTLGSPFQAGGSIGNTSFGISGTLPGFATTPTFNLGTLNGAATASNQSTMITDLAALDTTLGSPFQAGGAIGNTSFGISGTLPAFAATPTVNLGSLNGAATASNQSSQLTQETTTAAETTAIASSAATIATNTTGVSTAANQSTQITDLGNINTSVQAIQSRKITDGTNTAAVKAASTAPVATDPALVVAVSPNTPAIPVSGTFWQSTQPVSGTFWQTTQPVSGTFWQTTQPVSAASLPLPSNAAQETGGNLATTATNTGTTATNVSTVNTTLSNVQGSVSGGTAATKSALVGGQYNSTAPTLTNGQQAAFQFDSSGNVKENRAWTLGYSGDSVTSYQGGTWTLGRTWTLGSGTDTVSAVESGNWSTRTQDGSGNAITSQTSGSQRALDVGIDVSGTPVDPRQIRALTSSDTVTANQGNAPWSDNVTQFGGTNISTGTGVGGAGIPRVTVSSDSIVGTKAPVNANATLSARQTVTSTESNLAAPSNAVAVIVECESVNADNLRWGFSNSTSAILSSTLGMLCEPGRSENIPVGAGTYLHMISTGSGSDYLDAQWVLSQ